jgi:hypothetical protein
MRQMRFAFNRSLSVSVWHGYIENLPAFVNINYKIRWNSCKICVFVQYLYINVCELWIVVIEPHSVYMYKKINVSCGYTLLADILGSYTNTACNEIRLTVHSLCISAAIPMYVTFPVIFTSPKCPFSTAVILCIFSICRKSEGTRKDAVEEICCWN